jgi:tRNA(fMet)-specific endonuclease VapC
MKYLLDTNTIIYFFKSEGNISTRLLSVPPKDIGISAIVYYELLFGISKSIRQKEKIHQLGLLIDATNLIPFGEKEAHAAAKIRANLEKRGLPIGPMDVLIGATALANHAILVTHNLKEFKRIDRLEVEDWYDYH